MGQKIRHEIDLKTTEEFKRMEASKFSSGKIVPLA